MKDQAENATAGTGTGSEKTLCVDAAGGLSSVTETVGAATTTTKLTTSYTYDALNNLKTVTQGAQTRSFVYDSLSRLTSATNPESGTILYFYDNNGNLIERRDPRRRRDASGAPLQDTYISTC